jgi:5'(3')-deoxyribonucleotidase
MLSTNKPLAIVDLDDTMGDFCNILMQSLNYRFRKRFRKSDFVDFHGILDMYQITFAQFAQAIKDDHLMESCAPLPGTRACMERLVKDHHVAVVTSRDYDPLAHMKTDYWMSLHKLPAHQVLIPDQGQTKADAIKLHLGVAPAVIFDDALHNIYSLAAEFQEAQLFVPEQPWNAAISGKTGNLHCVPTFREGVSCYYADYVEGR